MQICASCSRHYRQHEPFCPFCGPSSWSTPAVTPSLIVGLGLFLAAASCADDGAPSDPVPMGTTGTQATEDGSASLSSTTNGGDTTNTTTSTGMTSTTNTTWDDRGESYYAGPDDDDWGLDTTTTSDTTGTGSESTDTGTDTTTGGD